MEAASPLQKAAIGEWGYLAYVDRRNYAAQGPARL